MSMLKMMCLAVVEAYNTEGQMKPQTLSREPGMLHGGNMELEYPKLKKARDLDIYGGSKNNKEVRVAGDCTKRWQTDKTSKEDVCYRMDLGCLVEE